MRAAASTEQLRPEALIEKAKVHSAMLGLGLVDQVTTTRPFRWIQGKPHPVSEEQRNHPWKAERLGL